MDTRNDMDAIDYRMNAMDAMDTMGAVDAMDDRDAIDAMDPMNAMDNSDDMDAMDTIATSWAPCSVNVTDAKMPRTLYGRYGRHGRHGHDRRSFLPGPT